MQALPRQYVFPKTTDVNPFDISIAGILLRSPPGGLYEKLTRSGYNLLVVNIGINLL